MFLKDLRHLPMLRDTVPTAITLNGEAADDGRVAAVYRCRVPMDELQATNHPDISRSKRLLPSLLVIGHRGPEG